MRAVFLTGFIFVPMLIHAADSSRAAVEALQDYLKTPKAKRAPITEQAFAKVHLTVGYAAKARERLWTDHLIRLRGERAAEMKAKVIRYGELAMKFEYFVYGEKPEDGRSLFISLHGGGSGPARLNDGQWDNQKRLYRPKKGIYLAPRAPTNTWDLWHQGHVDPMFARLIENMVALHDVNLNRVYLMGYSAGGDGVYQVAPRMADYWAAAAMMAGHPNETSPLGLRNLPFAIHVGERDSGFNRNKVALKWKDKLSALQKEDRSGYIHFVRIHTGRGHWMNREDAVALDWMAKHTRQPLPKRIVWKQDNVVHDSFYWLSLPAGQAAARMEIKATVKGQVVELSGPAGKRVEINLSDALVNLKIPVKIMSKGKELFSGKLNRTIGNLKTSLDRRRDRNFMLPTRREVTLP